MNATTAVQGMQKIQSAFQILAALQMTSLLFPPQAQVEDGASFDFIVVGAGSAGSVIANRLTENDQSRVLLVEAGSDPPIESQVAGFFPYLKKTEYDWDYVTEDDGYSQQFHKNHGVELTRGKMLGGCSSINFMVYIRGNYYDFNNWAKLTGDEIWNWDNVLPYFMKSERLVDPVLLKSNQRHFHGIDGYINTTRHYNAELTRYYKAVEELGYDIVLDVNGDSPFGYTEPMFSYDNGVRQSTAYSFLSPIKNRPNLYVLKNTLVSKILFDEHKNAIGIEAILDDNSTVTFKAKKEVIVSGGSINTPQLLMLSGVGPKEHLQTHNIEVISDLPVGTTLQDHIFVTMTHAMGNATPSKPYDASKFPSPVLLGFARLNETQDYPDYQVLSFVFNEPSPMLQYCSFYFSYLDEICQALYDGSIDKEVLYTLVVLISPESRGKVLLRSVDPKIKPVVYTGYYSNDKDLDNHATYLKDFLKIQETEVFKSLNAKLVVPEACGCGDLDFSQRYWKCYALCMMVSGYHYAGSCSMGTVVDSRLNVYGVQRLRIADASVMPQITTANTNPATIMIGEKAADFIKADHYYDSSKI